LLGRTGNLAAVSADRKERSRPASHHVVGQPDNGYGMPTPGSCIRRIFHA